MATLKEKEHGLVEEAKRYSLDVVVVFSTKCGGSNSVELAMGGNSSTPALSQHSLPRLE